jgi:hypothetical protein
MIMMKFASSTKLESPNFYVIKNTYVNVDANELNVILSICIYKEIDDDDESDLEFNKEDDVGHDNEENKKEGSN